MCEHSVRCVDCNTFIFAIFYVDCIIFIHFCIYFSTLSYHFNVIIFFQLLPDCLCENWCIISVFYLFWKLVFDDQIDSNDLSDLPTWLCLINDHQSASTNLWFKVLFYLFFVADAYSLYFLWFFLLRVVRRANFPLDIFNCGLWQCRFRYIFTSNQR